MDGTASGVEKTTNASRELCHSHRDAYYACAEDKAQNCKDARVEYERACLKSWTKYWDERVRRGLPLRVGVK